MEQGQDGVDRLSEGQKDCLRLVLGHKTSKEIAQLLGVSPHTVDQRIRYAIRTLGVRSRGEAALVLHAEDRAEDERHISSVDTQSVPSTNEGHILSDTHWYQRSVHQTPDLHVALANQANPTGRVFSSQEDGYRPAEPEVLQELYRGAQGSRQSYSPDEDPVSLRAVSGGESYADRFIGDGRLGWGRKLVLVILIALMSIMAAGSLLTGREALSDFLN